MFVPIVQEIVFSFDEPCTRSYVPYADGKSSVALNVKKWPIISK